jgi:hypothetical protein
MSQEKALKVADSDPMAVWSPLTAHHCSCANLQQASSLL